jgi:hypothetical protein
MTQLAESGPLRQHVTATVRPMQRYVRSLWSQRCVRRGVSTLDERSALSGRGVELSSVLRAAIN